MNPFHNANPSFRHPQWRGAMAALASGAVLFLAPAFVHAQNAKQLAALARLNSAGRVHAENAQPNGGEAISAPLVQPYQIAFDSAGNVYIADSGDELIREINVDGVVNTVAGNGNQGFGGDNGPATQAQLDTPTGLAVDAAGNLYIADSNNNRVREVTGGNITTIAGTGAPGYSGDGGAATAATLDSPGALAIDSTGNLFIADSNNECIRKISGGIITTVAGDGFQGFGGDNGPATSAMLDTPAGIAVDAAGNLYIGDTNNQRVRMVAAGTGIITTIAGTGTAGFNSDGAALSTQLANPGGLALNASGTLYIADAVNNRIRSLNGGQIVTIAGVGVQGYSGDAGAATSAVLNTPEAVVAGNSGVLFSDTGNNVVRLIDNGNVNTVGGNTPAGSESLQIAGALSTMYGTGSLTATFSNNGQTATGQVTFYDGEGANPGIIGQATLAGNAAAINTSTLPAGTHYIVATYAGDSKNSAIGSGVFVYVVTPAPLTAVANGLNLLYGQAIPALSGTLTGVLAQDAGKVTASYTATATATSAPGLYPISVALTGSAAGNYTVSLGAGSGSITIAPAPSTTTLTASSGSPILGTSLTLTAMADSTTTGTPTGTVNFYNGTTLLNSAPVALGNGIATLALTSLPVGSQSITATYSGSTDFISSTSNPVTELVLSPDFTIASTPSSQSVLPLQSVNYSLSVTPTNSTFVYPVTFTASGLPSGVTASFNPSTIAAGSAASTTSLTLTASSQALMHENRKPFGIPGSTALALLILVFRKRTRRAASSLSRASTLLLALIALAAVSTLSACGGGGFFSHSTKAYTVTVTATSGPNTHTTSVNVTVQ